MKKCIKVILSMCKRNQSSKNVKQEKQIYSCLTDTVRTQSDEINIVVDYATFKFKNAYGIAFLDHKLRTGG